MKSLFLPPSMYRDKRKIHYVGAETKAVLNAECDAETWWKYAEENPLAARRSPLFDLLTLEDPTRWFALKGQFIHLWLHRYGSRLDWWRLAVFGFHCALRVLPVFAPYPLQQVFVHGVMSDMALMLRGESGHYGRVHMAGERLQDKIQKERELITSPDLAWKLDIIRKALRLNIGTPTYAMEAMSGSSGRIEETYWQWDHLQGFLRKEQA